MCEHLAQVVPSREMTVVIDFIMTAAINDDCSNE